MDTTTAVLAFVAIVFWFLLFFLSIKTKARIFLVIGVMPIFYFMTLFSSEPFMLISGIGLVLFQLWYAFFGGTNI